MAIEDLIKLREEIHNAKVERGELNRKKYLIAKRLKLKDVVEPEDDPELAPKKEKEPTPEPDTTPDDEVAEPEEDEQEETPPGTVEAFGGWKTVKQAEAMINEFVELVKEVEDERKSEVKND